jgi:hypothetical protein
VSSTPAAAPQVIRGYPERLTNLMEELQKSYLHAVAAAAGCIVSVDSFDDGIDATLKHKSDTHTAGDRTARLEVQLKATHNAPSGGYASVTMANKRYREFSVAAPLVPKIVVIMHMPADPADWILAKSKSLRIHHSGYWVNLAGKPESSALRPTVKAPLTQRFDDLSLCLMMSRIGSGGKP